MSLSPPFVLSVPTGSPRVNYHVPKLPLSFFSLLPSTIASRRPCRACTTDDLKFSTWRWQRSGYGFRYHGSDPFSTTHMQAINWGNGRLGVNFGSCENRSAVISV